MITELRPNIAQECAIKLMGFRNQLDELQATIFMKFMIAEMHQEHIDEAWLKELDSKTPCRIYMTDRVKNNPHFYQFKVSDYLMIALTLMFEARLGSITMLLACIQYYVFQHPELKDNTITISIFARIFSIGIPNESQLQSVWDSQKCTRFHHYDNALDYAESYKSIRL